MSKPESYPVPESNEQNGIQRNHNRGQQLPHSGSKKTKQQNHVSHNNPEG